MPGDYRENTILSGAPQAAARIFAVVALASSLPAAATSQSLHGTTLDAATRVPVMGTAVTLVPVVGSQPRRATSDSAGYFVFPTLRPGLYTISATRLGYQQPGTDTVRIGESESVRVEITLGRTTTSLKPVIVTARYSGLPEGFESRRASGFGRFLTRTDIDARSASNTSDLLRGFPGVVLTAQRRGPGSTLLMRGATGLCQPAIWIDGVYVAQYSGITIDNMLSPGAIEAAEVYNSAATAPVQYRTGTCGVVLFWTRRAQHDERARTKWWKIALGASAAAGLVLLIR